MGELGDFLRREVGEDMPGEVAEECVAQTVDAFEVLEKQDQPFEMRSAEFAVDAVERVRHRVGDRLLLKEGLQVENVLAKPGDLSVLRFRKTP